MYNSCSVLSNSTQKWGSNYVKVTLHFDRNDNSAISQVYHSAKGYWQSGSLKLLMSLASYSQGCPWLPIANGMSSLWTKGLNQFSEAENKFKTHFLKLATAASTKLTCSFSFSTVSFCISKSMSDSFLKGDFSTNVTQLWNIFLKSFAVRRLAQTR